MKLILAILGLGFLSTVSAQTMTCLDKLLPYSRYSGLHQLTIDEWTDGKPSLDADGALNAFKALITLKLLCNAEDVEIKVQPVCSQLIADLPQSNTCFLFTNLGYATISRDNRQNANFVFVKDKKFNP